MGVVSLRYKGPLRLDTSQLLAPHLGIQMWRTFARVQIDTLRRLFAGQRIRRGDREEPRDTSCEVPGEGTERRCVVRRL